MMIIITIIIIFIIIILYLAWKLTELQRIYAKYKAKAVAAAAGNCAIWVAEVEKQLFI